MQRISGASSSRVSTIMIVVAVVLALIGIGGIATGAADKPTKVAATNDTTTTVPLGGFGGGGGDTGPTITTLPGAPGPSTTAAGAKGSTPTTVKGTSGSTAPANGGDCPTPPNSPSDPGAEAAPAVGTYTYASCSNASDTTDVQVAAGQNTNGFVRRDVTETANGLSQTATESWSSSGILQEVLTIKSGFADIRCDWNPDVLMYPAQLTVGKTWSADSKCTIQNPQDPSHPITLHVSATGKISGRVTPTVGGTALNCWLVDADIKLDTPQGQVEVVETDYFDPVHGVNVYRHSTSKSQQGSVERVDHLKSITPH